MAGKPKRIALVGSTGNIGRQALETIAGDEGLAVCALAAGRNWQLLARQAVEFEPQAVAIADASAREALAAGVPRGTEVVTGPDCLAEVIRRTRPDLVLTAVVGTAGLAPTLAAIECRADLAIANKESLVMAGGIVMPAARRAGINVLPVDSEHSAVFQCLRGHRREDVRRVVLTASGGPFRTWPTERAGRATLAEVLNHPTWRMGRKVTIDSATLMNKALEIIEAHWLFELPAERIDVLIHPESLVHALVEFCDGSVLAQMGTPSMTTPIAFALHYPNRAPKAAAPLDLASLGGLHFAPADTGRFPALQLGYEVVARGGTSGAILNAANEAAVEAFVQGRISFGQIPEVVREVLDQAAPAADVSLQAILQADAAARRQAEEVIAQRTAPQRQTS